MIPGWCRLEVLAAGRKGDALECCWYLVSPSPVSVGRTPPRRSLGVPSACSAVGLSVEAHDVARAFSDDPVELLPSAIAGTEYVVLELATVSWFHESSVPVCCQ